MCWNTSYNNKYSFFFLTNMLLRIGCLLQHFTHSPEFSNFSSWSSLVSYITSSYLQHVFWVVTWQRKLGGGQAVLHEEQHPPSALSYIQIAEELHQQPKCVEKSIRSFLTAAIRFHNKRFSHERLHQPDLILLHACTSTYVNVVFGYIVNCVFPHF